MKIYRQNNGKRFSYTLSRAELRKAYDEQQHLYDIEDVKNELDCDRDKYVDEYGIDKRPVSKDEIEQMALKLRYYLDVDADSAWSVCVRDAVAKILSERK